MARLGFTGYPLHNIASTLVFVQLNDVYQIDAVADYRRPDSLILPRVATVVERLRQRWGDRVHLFLPGDFLAPSAMSQMYKGEQMVDVLNSMGVDLVCIGNHEFDVDSKQAPGKELLKRIGESKFDWVCSNIELDGASSGLAQKVLSFKLLKFSPDTDVILIGLLGKMKGVPVTAEPVETVGRIISTVSSYLTHEYPDRDSEFFFVALTHQDLSDDRKLANSEKRLHLILGGHDHEVVEVLENSECLIAKARSNARTLRLNFLISLPSELFKGPLKVMDRQAIMRDVADQLVDQCVSESLGTIFAAVSDEDPITEALVETAGPVVHFIPGRSETTFILSVGVKTDHPLFLERVPCSPAVTARIQHWAARANKESDPSFAQRLGMAPEILTLQDRVIRRESTNFGILTADALRDCWHVCGHAKPSADVGLINGGTFRLDRNIQKGEWITQRTLCEIFYYENVIQEYSIAGRDLLGLLSQSHERRWSFKQEGDAEGDGQFVQIAGIRAACRAGAPVHPGRVSLAKPAAPLDLDREYRVVTTDYLATQGPYAGFFRKPAIQDVPLRLRALVARSLDSMLARVESGSVMDGSQGWVEADN